MDAKVKDSDRQRLPAPESLNSCKNGCLDRTIKCIYRILRKVIVEDKTGRIGKDVLEIVSIIRKEETRRVDDCSKKQQAKENDDI